MKTINHTDRSESPVYLSEKNPYQIFHYKHVSKKSFLRLSYFAAILIALLLIAYSTTAQTRDVEEALYMSETERPKKGIDQMEKLMQANLTDASLFYYLGYIQMKAGEYDKALSSFEKGIKLNDKEPLNYAGEGYLNMKQKKFSEAKILFDKALQISKMKNVEVLKAVAEAYLLDKKYLGDAIQLLSKAKAIGETDPEVSILFGDAQWEQNNGGLAVSSYEQAATIDPKLARAYYKIGLVYVRARTYDVALESLKKTVSLDHEYTLAFKELGELYYLMKKGEDAVKAYETYLSLTERPEVGKLRYAFFLFMAKDYPKANEIFKSLNESPEANPLTLRFYAYSLFEVGDYQQSRTTFETYFSKAPSQDVEASDYAYYGKVLLKLNEEAPAIINFQKSLAMDKDQVEIMQLLAETDFKIKNYPDAIVSYRRLMAKRQKPVSQDYYSIGRAFYFNKQYQESDSAFVKLIELQPNMTVGYLWEARAKSNLDPESEKGLAKPYYEKLIEKAVANPDKGKSDLIEAYSYLGYYHFIKNEMSLSKSYWEKVIALNPADEKAKEALKAIH